MSEETSARKDVLWGVDLSASAASIGWTAADGSARGVVTATWDHSLRGGARLATAYEATRALSRALARDHPAVFVYVEQPSGRARGLELVYMAGIIQAAIFDALRAHWHKDVEIRTVPSATWKKDVLGRGDYRKPKKTENFEYEAIKWAKRNNIDVADDNEADSICIAECARLRVSFT